MLLRFSPPFYSLLTYWWVIEFIIFHLLCMCCFFVWGVHFCYSGPPGLHVFVFLIPTSLVLFGQGSVFSLRLSFPYTFQDVSLFQFFHINTTLPVLISPWAVQWVHFAFCRWQPPGGTQDFTTYSRQGAWIQDASHWFWEGIWCGVAGMVWMVGTDA